MIAAGTKLTFDARGTAGGWTLTSTDAVREGILSALQSDFIVESVIVSGQGSFYELMEWQFTARIVAAPRNAYGKFDDVAAMVAHAIYEATGNLASVGQAGTQGSISTGGVGGGIVQSITDGIASIADKVTKGIGQGIVNVAKPAADEVTDEINTILVILGVVLVAGVFILAGKRTRVGI